jgi:hypothetical protein
MSNGYGYRRHGLVGPAVLITVGCIFLADRWWPDYGMHRMWPLILIVIGVVRLLDLAISRGGQDYPPPPPPGSVNPPPQPPPAGGSQ